jgi:hypothetical protein
MLYQLAQNNRVSNFFCKLTPLGFILIRFSKGLDEHGRFQPQKYFSIDRVFRNETLDATHLAEFHQIEGVIAMEGLTLGDLIGVLYEFFNKLGIKKLRFKVRRKRCKGVGAFISQSLFSPLTTPTRNPPWRSFLITKD